MNNYIEIVIPGKPIAKQRARRDKYSGHWYNSQETEMNIVRRLIKEQLPESFLMIEKNIPVIVNMTFLFPPLKSESKEFIKKIESNNSILPYLKKYDLDNLNKFFLDCMTEIVFFDDAQVYAGALAKYYTMPGSEKTIIGVEW